MIAAITRWMRPAAPVVTASDAGRALAELGTMSTRERYRARARIMCEQQGKPVPACLETRG